MRRNFVRVVSFSDRDRKKKNTKKAGNSAMQMKQKHNVS